MTDKERQARIHHHMYTTNEGIAEHAERIVALEELCELMWNAITTSCLKCEFKSDCVENHNGIVCIRRKYIKARMDELGIPH